LIDDVITTGATLGEAAKLLKINGAHKIIALCLAKG
jgi:predicted amidophosphoribosyltransferase